MVGRDEMVTGYVLEEWHRFQRGLGVLRGM